MLSINGSARKRCTICKCSASTCSIKTLVHLVWGDSERLSLGIMKILLEQDSEHKLTLGCHLFHPSMADCNSNFLSITACPISECFFTRFVSAFQVRHWQCYFLFNASETGTLFLLKSCVRTNQGSSATLNASLRPGMKVYKVGRS